MSAQTDLDLNGQAEALADRAMTWIGDNKTLQALKDSDEITYRYDCANHIFYVQKPDGINVKFGHILMREGIKRNANAAAVDLKSIGGEYWALCAISDHPETDTVELAPHVTNATLIHEAVHYMDFARTGYKPAPFASGDMNNLAQNYYNTPWEFNAFFHEGLYSFKRDFHLVRLNDPCRDRAILRHLTNGAYWSSHFIYSLNRTYRQKVFRRYGGIYAHLAAYE